MVHGVVPAGRQVLVGLSASLGGRSWSEALQQLMLSASSTLCGFFFFFATVVTRCMLMRCWHVMKDGTYSMKLVQK